MPTFKEKDKFPDIFRAMEIETKLRAKREHDVMLAAQYRQEREAKEQKQRDEKEKASSLLDSILG